MAENEASKPPLPRIFRYPGHIGESDELTTEKAARDFERNITAAAFDILTRDGHIPPVPKP